MNERQKIKIFSNRESATCFSDSLTDHNMAQSIMLNFRCIDHLIL